MKNIVKKTIFQYSLPVLLLLLVFVSCDHYLDVDPKGVQILETVKDYDEWLNSSEIELSLPSQLNLLADNVDDPTIPKLPTAINDRVYTWQAQFLEDVGSSAIVWTNFYKSIYYFNTVILGIDDATRGSEEEKASLKAEALLGRAFEYLYLVNLYGKVYDQNTANQDLAVPFVTSNDLNTPTPDRATVQEIYDHIITDLTEAIPNLPTDNSDNRFRGSVAAAYSVLARAYLYMGDYTKAAQNAQQALTNGMDTILDYSIMTNENDITDIQVREDAIYARLNTTRGFSLYPKLSFLQSFDTTDLRLPFFYRNYDDYDFMIRGKVKYYSFTSTTAYPNWGTSVAEMRLILAEAAARRNEMETACDELDHVRKCRFPEFIIDNTVTPPDTTYRYKKFESTNQEEVLQKVLDERRFEFAFTGMRWFDMRRLDAEGRMPDVYRYDGENNVIVTLPAGSNKYTLQIPIQVLYFNPDWSQNFWDEE